MTARLAPLAVLAFAVAACSKPEPPETDRPPEPQASTVAATPSALRQSMQTPIEQAKNVETTVLDAAEAQRAAVEAETAGNAPADPQQPGNVVPTY